MPEYCCQFMKEQLNYHCEKHGDNCPDVVIQVCQSQYHKNELVLIGRNAEYECKYGPSCGTKWLKNKLP